MPHGFHDFKLSNSVANAYHALAIDDVRKSFHPVLFEPGRNKNGELKQVWFTGMHSDVGGGYPGTESGLSDIALEWMIGHAVKHGLHIFHDPKQRSKAICAPNPYGYMHDARDKWWKKAVFTKRRRNWPAAYGKPIIHQSVELRAARLTNDPDERYQPWIKDLDIGYDVEPWTHLEDWKTDPDFKDAKASLKALAGWCEPRRPDRQ